MQKSMRDITNLVGLLRTNFNGCPEFRSVFNLVLICLPDETFEKLLTLTNDTLFLVQTASYASIERIFCTPPIPKPLTILQFSQRVTEEMNAQEQAGTIIHELCHILCLHKQFAFFDRHEPTPEYKMPTVIVEGEGKKATDLRVILGQDLTEREEGEANGLARVLGFGKQLDAVFQFIGRRKHL